MDERLKPALLSDHGSRRVGFLQYTKPCIRGRPPLYSSARVLASAVHSVTYRSLWLHTVDALAARSQAAAWDDENLCTLA